MITAGAASADRSLAGADATVNDDWSLTGSAAYSFNDNGSVELWSGLAKFEHEVSLAGLGTVASVEHRPTTLSVNYHFAPDSTVRPFIGLGYGWVNVSGERTLGALSGLGIDGSNAKGIAFGAGLDWFVSDNVFIRADVDPIVYGISAGLRF